MSMKKKALMGASYVLVAAMAIGGTVAYLTDTDKDINVMTLGNVQIEQIEQEWNEDKTELVEFTQDKPLLPYVGSLSWADKDDEHGGAYRTFAMENVVDKYVSVKNTGRNNAYVRTIIALEMGSYKYEEFTMVGISNNSANGVEFPNLHWSWDEVKTVNIEGKNYNVMIATYDEALAPNATTIPSMLQVYLDKTATNETVENLDGNNNGKYDILVFSQAVQADGFADADSAFAETFGEITAENHPWKDGIADNTDAKKLNAALEAASAVADKTKRVATMEDDLYTTGSVDLGGAGVTLDGAGYTLAKSGKVDSGTNAGVEGTAGTIKNLNVVDNTDKDSAKGFRAIYFTSVTGDMVIDNCTLDGTYALNVNAGNENYSLTVTNSTLKGWTSFAKVKAATFTNCTFAESTSNYNHFRAYSEAVLTNCELAGTTVDTYDPYNKVVSGKIKFVNCTYNGEPITADMLTTVCASGYGEEIDAQILDSVTVGK